MRFSRLQPKAQFAEAHTLVNIYPHVRRITVCERFERKNDFMHNSLQY